MIKARNKKDIINRLKKSTDDIQYFFKHLEKLISKDFPYEICISYLFSKIEKGQNNALYCGIVRFHKGEKDLTWETVANEQMNYNPQKEKDVYSKFFKIIYNKDFDNNLHKKLFKAKKIRNKIMHGGTASDEEMRQAIVVIIEYAEKFNEFMKSIFIHDKTPFTPFGRLSNVFGRIKTHQEKTTGWILKGMGFNIGDWKDKYN